jgi:hypothetical protein
LPRYFAAWSARLRAARSASLAALNGTTSVIGFEGYCAWRAPEAPSRLNKAMSRRSICDQVERPKEEQYQRVTFAALDRKNPCYRWLTPTGSHPGRRCCAADVIVGKANPGYPRIVAVPWRVVGSS